MQKHTDTRDNKKIGEGNPPDSDSWLLQGG